MITEIPRRRTDAEQAEWNAALRGWHNNWFRSFTGLYEDLCMQLGHKWGKREFLSYALMLYGVPHARIFALMSSIDKKIPTAQSYDP